MSYRPPAHRSTVSPFEPGCTASPVRVTKRDARDRLDRLSEATFAVFRLSSEVDHPVKPLVPPPMPDPEVPLLSRPEMRCPLVALQAVPATGHVDQVVRNLIAGEVGL
jgi:hypothetical protein